MVCWWHVFFVYGNLCLNDNKRLIRIPSHSLPVVYHYTVPSSLLMAYPIQMWRIQKVDTLLRCIHTQLECAHNIWEGPAHSSEDFWHNNAIAGGPVVRLEWEWVHCRHSHYVMVWWWWLCVCVCMFLCVAVVLSHSKWMNFSFCIYIARNETNIY